MPLELVFDKVEKQPSHGHTRSPLQRELVRPELKIKDFEGPLDLLFHLIEKNDIDIYDIPVAEITDQYMTFLKDMTALDMEVASEFLVMAATLIHIKSRMLLPGKKTAQMGEGEEDPREELVIRLLHYRRCKLLARDLKEHFLQFSEPQLRLPATMEELDIRFVPPPQSFEDDAFHQAISAVCARNELRFADLATKITHILRRDKISVRDKMKIVLKNLLAKGRLFFHEIFPSKDMSKIERVVGFLAVLELLRSNKICADQDKPFGVIEIRPKLEVEEENIPHV